MTININALISGCSEFNQRADNDLKKIISKEPVTSFRGGYRVLNSELFGIMLQEECRGELTDYEGNTVEIGIVQSNLQTPNYRALRTAPFPPDETVMYGKVDNDRSDKLRIWPEALVLGSLSTYDSCAIRWRGSKRYLLIPYTANVFNMCAEHWAWTNDQGQRYRSVYRQVHPSGSVRQCLGSIKSGGLEAVAYNSDLMVDYYPEYNVLGPLGFLPVFSAEKPGDSLAEKQDRALALFLAQFMPEEDESEEVAEILEDEIPGITEATEAFRKSGDIADLPADYVTAGTSQKVYETYIKILASTYIRAYTAGE